MEKSVRETLPQYKIDTISLKTILDRKKGIICKEFEKICPTEVSLKRIVKEMHDIFDDLERDLKDTFKI